MDVQDAGTRAKFLTRDHDAKYPALIWNEQHLPHALRAYEPHYNEHRTHGAFAYRHPPAH
ncbi:hypothetical protein ACIHCV_45660 [Streptomyces sp. NPDC051956]|uniref:hypothetical protein n=1 Tax=Streptomyces sp. NPDC051956 TaxID=3365677 RepID=UPI0037D137BE